MKKLLLVVVLAFAGYKFYQHGFSFSSPRGAFDEQGNARVILFVGPGCGEHCDKVRSSLQNRKVDFEEVEVVNADGAPVTNKFGISNYPVTLIGSRKILGDDTMGVTAALAETLGRSVLSRTENRIMDRHFDVDGRPQVVMYGTKWCPYCKRQRQYFADNTIAYTEIDVEASEANTSIYNALEGNGYPLTYVGYRRFDGYKERELLAAIDEMKKTGARR
jgi:glutaredoxin